jgi:hypothetical protein
MARGAAVPAVVPRVCAVWRVPAYGAAAAPVPPVVDAPARAVRCRAAARVPGTCASTPWGIRALSGLGCSRRATAAAQCTSGKTSLCTLSLLKPVETAACHLGFQDGHAAVSARAARATPPWVTLRVQQPPSCCPGLQPSRCCVRGAAALHLCWHARGLLLVMASRHSKLP